MTVLASANYILKFSNWQLVIFQFISCKFLKCDYNYQQSDKKKFSEKRNTPNNLKKSKQKASDFGICFSTVSKLMILWLD